MRACVCVMSFSSTVIYLYSLIFIIKKWFFFSHLQFPRNVFFILPFKFCISLQENRDVSFLPITFIPIPSLVSMFKVKGWKFTLESHLYGEESFLVRILFLCLLNLIFHSFIHRTNRIEFVRTRGLQVSEPYIQPTSNGLEIWCPKETYKGEATA